MSCRRRATTPSTSGPRTSGDKPNPAVLAEDTWHLDKAEHELENVLSKAKAHGCVVEVIMKDISTVRYQPQRLWEWARMATEVTERYGG